MTDRKGDNYEAIKPLLAEGRLPNLARLLEEGTIFPNALPPFPTLTGSNWATIATGAWPGTHGVTDMSYHVTGEPAEHWHSGFTSDAVEAQTIWEALADDDKKSIILKYTGSWPPRDPGIIMVDGGGGRPFWGGSILELSHSQLFSTESRPNAAQLQTRPAQGWSALPKSTQPVLEFGFDYQPTTGRIPEFLQFNGEAIVEGESTGLWGLLYASGSNGYDTVTVSSDKDISKAWVTLKPGQWSETLERTFHIQGEAQQGAFRILFNILDAKEGKFSLYFTQVYPVDAFTQPPELGRVLTEKFGAYINHPGFSARAMDWITDEQFIELLDYQNEWLAQAGQYLMENYEWDLFAMQAHCIDFANHAFLLECDASQSAKEEALRKLHRCYESADRMVGKLVEAAGSEALICVVSDHGATANLCPEVSINDILEEAGLLVYEEPTSDEVIPKIDWSRTTAVQQRNAFIYINLEGREPHGIVAPDRYEEARDNDTAQSLCHGSAQGKRAGVRPVR